MSTARRGDAKRYVGDELPARHPILPRGLMHMKLTPVPLINILREPGNTRKAGMPQGRRASFSSVAAWGSLAHALYAPDR